MNFKRVEIIFLIAFMLLNIYLFSIAKDTNFAQTTTPNQHEDITLILKKENISMPHRLKNTHTTGAYIVGNITNLYAGHDQLQQQTITDNQGVLTSQWDTHLIMTGTTKDVRQSLQKFLKQPHGIQYGDDYHYVSEASQSDNTICFAQYIDGKPIFDESAETIFIKEKLENKRVRIVGYKQQHVSNLRPLRDAQPLISEKEAIDTLYRNSKLSSGDTINWIVLGYTKLLTHDNQNVYVPTWIVSIHNGTGIDQVEKVNAIMNRIMSGNNDAQKY